MTSPSSCSGRMLLGRGDALVSASASDWYSKLEAHLPSMRAVHDGLDPLQQAVRRAAVLLLPAADGRPVTARRLAREVGTPLGLVRGALAALERKLFFVVLDGDGDVAWAFPVTASPTPHRLLFDSGERLYGA